MIKSSKFSPVLIFVVLIAAIALFGWSMEENLKSNKLFFAGKEKKIDISDKIGIFITHGPILGRPGSTQMGVWARTSKPGKFRVIYDQRPDDLKLSSPSVETTLARDNTGWVLIENLNPDTKYYFAVVTGDEVPMPRNRGSFRTLPAADHIRNPKYNPEGLFNFSFEVGCGNAQNEIYSIGPDASSFGTMLNHLKDKIHFAVQTGDFIYEDRREFPLAEWLKEQSLTENEVPKILRIAPTLTGVWENYKIYLERSNHLAAWHRHIPSYFMFDDHEILNDVMGCSVPGHRSRPACFRDIGVKAWYDYIGWSNPVSFTQDIHFGEARLKKGSDILEDKNADFTRLDLSQMATLTIHWGTTTAGVWDPLLDRDDQGDKNAGVYEITKVIDKHRIRLNPKARIDGVSSYSVGRRNYYAFRVSNSDFYVLDTRSHRDVPVLNQERIRGQSMLGFEQKQWLKKNMSASDADFLFVVSTVNVMIPHTGKGGFVQTTVKTDESWTGFLEEREELIEFWQSLKKPVIVLSGDLHNAFAIKITDNIWEFTASPHSSGNHDLKSEGSRPINGKYDSAGRVCDIRWSTFFLDDVQTYNRRQPVYTVVRVNNVFPNSTNANETRWVAYPHPQVIVQFYDGFTGDLLYAESIVIGK